MDWKKTMSKSTVDKGGPDYDRAEMEAVFRKYAEEMREDLNFRLFCEEEQRVSFGETLIPSPKILWVEDVIMTDITYPEKRKTGSRFKGIRELFRRIKKIFSNLF